MTNQLNSYQLSRTFFDWCFENPEKIHPTHIAMYFFIIEHCNRLGWKDKFGLPTIMVKEAIGIRNFRTYTKTLNDLVEWGFIIMIEKSKNQYSSNIVAIVQNAKAPTKALDKAMQKQLQKQSNSTVTIDKQETIEQETIKHTNTIFSFDEFWEAYNKKTGRVNCERIYARLKDKDYAKIKETLPIYLDSVKEKDIKYKMNPQTYLNGRYWEDEIYQEVKTTEPTKPALPYEGFNPLSIDLSKLKPLR
jgi:hypothetical protein